MRNQWIAVIAFAALFIAPGAFAGLDVVVDGVRRPEYVHRGTTYVEAIRGREYALRVTNPYPYRVAVALAVDGLNTIDARHTDGWNASKWVLDPYESTEISGWQVNDSTARRFFFTGERNSYGAFLGATENLGVIEAIFYRERRRGRRSSSRYSAESGVGRLRGHRHGRPHAARRLARRPRPRLASHRVRPPPLRIPSRADQARRALQVAESAGAAREGERVRVLPAALNEGQPLIRASRTFSPHEGRRLPNSCCAGFSSLLPPQRGEGARRADEGVRASNHQPHCLPLFCVSSQSSNGRK
jgi:hypothetical protein